MKKIVLFIAFIMSGLFLQAQSTWVERAQEKEMDKLEKIVTFEHKNLVFNKNQIAKLERVFFKKATERQALRNDESVGKAEFLGEYNKIQAKYKPMVEAILSPEQKIEYRKHEKKRIKTLKN